MLREREDRHACGETREDAGEGVMLSDDYRGVVRRGILREKDTLVLDVEWYGNRYDVKLQRQAKDRFAGTWTTTRGENRSVAATHFRSSEGDMRFGGWIEDGTRYHCRAGNHRPIRRREVTPIHGRLPPSALNHQRSTLFSPPGGKLREESGE
jgi:hypothetical protein